MRSRQAICLPIVVALAACVGSARTFDVYSSKAENSLEQSRSGVQTTLSAIDLAIGRRAFASSVSITIEDANETVGGAESAFASIQPPDQASDELRRKVLPVLSDAADALQQATIAARRVDVATLAGLRSRLTDLAERLDQLLGELT